MPWVKFNLDPKNLIYIGIWDLDPQEIKFIKGLGIIYYKPEDIDDCGGIG